MTDAPILKIITCLDPTGEREECGAVVENTLEARRVHRAWHAQDKKVKDAFRSAINSRDEKIRSLELRLADIQRDVEHIDIPVPASPIEIDSDGWNDDDEPEPSDLDQPASTYTDEDINATIAMNPADLPQPPAGHTVTYGPGITT